MPPLGLRTLLCSCWCSWFYTWSNFTNLGKQNRLLGAHCSVLVAGWHKILLPLIHRLWAWLNVRCIPQRMNVLHHSLERFSELFPWADSCGSLIFCIHAIYPPLIHSVTFTLPILPNSSIAGINIASLLQWSYFHFTKITTKCWTSSFFTFTKHAN